MSKNFIIITGFVMVFVLVCYALDSWGYINAQRTMFQYLASARGNTKCEMIGHAIQCETNE